MSVSLEKEPRLNPNLGPEDLLEEEGGISAAERLLAALEQGKDPDNDITELLDAASKRGTLKDRVVTDEAASLAVIEGITHGEEVPLALGEQPSDELAIAFTELADARGDEAVETVIGQIEKFEQEHVLTGDVEIRRAEQDDMYSLQLDEKLRTDIMREEARSTIDELRARGIPAETLLANTDKWSNDSLKTFADKYRTMLEGSTDLEETQQLADTLLRCQGLRVLQQDSALFDELAANPGRWRLVVETIAAHWSEIQETGFPKDIASTAVLGALNSYAIANGHMNLRRDESGSPNETYDDYALRKTKNTFVAMQIVGTAGLESKNTFHFKGPRDGFLSNITHRLTSGEQLDTERIHGTIREFAQTVERIGLDNPKVIEITKRIGFGVENPEELASLTEVLEGVSSKTELIRSLCDDDTQYEDTLTAFIYDHESMGRTQLQTQGGIDRESLLSGIDIATNFRAEEGRYDSRVYRQLLRNRPEHAREMVQIMLTPSLREYLSDERGQQEINDAIGAILHRDIDIDALVEAQKNVKTPLDGTMRVLALAQPKGEGAREEYYSLVNEHINALDKNGLPYNSPAALAEAAHMLTVSHEGARQDIDWFTQDTLPFAAFPAVIKMRERLVAQGVEDSPSAIYERYSKDAELIAELSRENLQSYLGGELTMAGSEARIAQEIDQAKMNELLVYANEQAESRKDAFRIFINIKAPALLAAANNGGALKSLLDTDIVDRKAMGNRDAEYVFKRSDVEVMMGNRSYGENDHPIYGSCGYIDRGTPGGAIGYGDVLLTFKPNEGDLAARTTYTPEDSFHGTHRLTEADARSLRIIKNGISRETDMLHASTSEYIETQIIGGVDMSTVDTIVAPDTATAEELRAQLPPELAQKVVDRAQVSNYNSSGEKTEFTRFKKSLR